LLDSLLQEIVKSEADLSRKLIESCQFLF